VCGAVRGEHVESEVRRRIPPYRVGVVGPALGVVPLDEQPRALEPVVVRGAALGGAGSGEVDGVQGVAAGR
jgi:hypothetical protein